jgi:hypothetical protein
MDIITCIFLLFFTALVSSIITEHAVIQRIQYSEGITFAGGKCRLKSGYGLKDDVTNAIKEPIEPIESIFTKK